MAGASSDRPGERPARDEGRGLSAPADRAQPGAAERPTIVVSAVNLTEGGTLSVLVDCLAHLSRSLASRYRIVALVHRRELCDFPGIEYLEYPRAKRSWLSRVLLEYAGFRRLSARLKPFLWLSLHDMTPNVVADRQAVYCHNPSPFHRLTARDAVYDPRFAAFCLLYKYLYRINIARNAHVIVQQQWIRDYFLQHYPVRSVLVAHPRAPAPPAGTPKAPAAGRGIRLLFPALPRVFKNIEALGDACRLMAASSPGSVEILVTVDGSESRYARHLVRRYRDVPSLRFIGRQTRDAVFRLYGEVDGLVFPSLLETWGLPLSEFQAFRKPILAANLPYARETIGDYPAAVFFDPRRPEDLARCGLALAAGAPSFEATASRPVPAPHARDWGELFDVLLR